MTPAEVIERLKAEGIGGRVLNGIPFVPEENVPTFEEKKRLLDLLAECGLGGYITEEGLWVTPGRPR